MLGFLYNWISRLAGTLIQLLQVPVLLHFWGKLLFGDWLMVSAIPSYLGFSNVGFGNVAGNEMTMLMGRGEQSAALRVFQSCWWLIVALCAGVTVLFSATLYVAPVAHWLQLQQMTESDAKWVIFYLGLAVLFGQLEQLIGAAYTCVGKYPYGTFIKSVVTLVAFAATLVPVVLGYGVRAAALTLSVVNALGTAVFCILVRRDIPWLSYGWTHASFAEIKRLSGPAIAFMGFPIGNALNLQGTLLAVGHVLGSADVVVFSTARTVSRVALQMVQLVNNTFWPELSSSFGAGNMALVRSLHRRSCQLALGISVALILVMMTIGPWFLTHWTLHKDPPSPQLLFLLMLSVFFFSLWSTSSTLLTAINQHRRLSVWYMGATGVTIAATVLMARAYGLMGAAGSLVLSEVLMDVYVLPTSLRISEDTWSGFSRAMMHIPASVRPRALLARLRKTDVMLPVHPEPDA